MRSLVAAMHEVDVSRQDAARTVHPGDRYERMLRRMKADHHTGCVFNRQSSVLPDVPVHFDDAGALHGEFTATELQQGYNGRMHGGVVAALIDASMAQCLMGHGVSGYTVSLTVKYRRPVALHRPTRISTRITGTAIGGSVYEMKCDLYQGRIRVAGATGRFYRERNA